ncbi:hypothetical protein [Nannocystis sp. SCPEA4]|uniref:hypothetical protein n=1 Tax=Nannocystis sp. SCPEA4 TaxID=2996787 RepID=UPI002270EED8|nr:hypothetical protein [Nannocystis sp. SCPEA4]MCY1056736.1 hypothetical protein [Nannocystis sp. SCPEA4]
MRHTSRLILASAAALLFAPSTVLAGNPHFIKNQTTASLSGSDLVVVFKEAGLPSGSTETITVSADFEGTFQCINGGGKNPNDPKKTVIRSQVSESGEFTADKNGNVTGSLTLSPPSPAQVGFSCPPGQQALRTTFSFSDITIDDEDSGASLGLPGTFSGGTPID